MRAASSLTTLRIAANSNQSRASPQTGMTLGQRPAAARNDQGGRELGIDARLSSLASVRAMVANGGSSMREE